MSRQRPDASGKFVVRMEPGLHAALREAARAAGTSLNDYCVRKLAQPCSAGSEVAAKAVIKASAIGGASLVGVAVFGSWARGEATDTSDVDLLIALDRQQPITRELYRRWDAAPLDWGRHAVEPHFVRWPDPDAPITGLWAEVAMDGLVLFERGYEISRRLIQLRARIARGDVVRRWSSGHPYWTAA